ncbi:cytokine-dependent hematopoietic cell linker isoform X2 [Polypterus senegalus]|nr:cytokine-dependent hematopoietic cell linker isoform X2 [Polypterus senegalus]
MRRLKPVGGLPKLNLDFHQNRSWSQLHSSLEDFNYNRDPVVGNSYAPAKIMDRRIMSHEDEDSDYEIADEQEYTIVEDPEESHPIRILPARHDDNNHEYADRQIPMLHAKTSSSPDFNRFNNIPPLTPKRPVPGPVINRDLKPNRRPQPPAVNSQFQMNSQNAQHPPRPVKKIPKERQPLPPEPILNIASDLQAIVAEPLKPRPAQRKRNNNINDLQKVLCPRPLLPVPSRCSQSTDNMSSHTAPAGRLSPNSNLAAIKPKFVHEWPQSKQDIQAFGACDFTDIQKPKIPGKKTYETLKGHSWYIGAYDRYKAEAALYKLNKDGSFLVRDCSKKIIDEPYVLVVFYANKVYNVKIRHIGKNQKYALGTGLWGNDMFDSISDIIEYYKIFPIILIDGKDKTGTQKEQCTLTYGLTEDEIIRIL